MFSITRTTGVAALLAVSLLMPWSSDALAAGHRRNQAAEHRQAVKPHAGPAVHAKARVTRRVRQHAHARQLARERDQLLARARRALSRGNLERAGSLFWRAARLERQLHRTGYVSHRRRR
jgi:hypothetical protein